MKNPFERIKGRYIFLLLIIYVLLGVIFSNLQINGVQLNLVSHMILLLLNILLLSFTVWWLIKSKINLRALIGEIPSSIEWLKIMGIFIPTILLSLGSSILFSYFFPVTPEELLYDLGSVPLILISSLLFIIFAPIIEELIFRGILLHRWTIKWNMGIAIVLSSLFFGLLHLDVIVSFIFGIVMSLLYLRTRTLIVPIIGHMLNNFFAAAPLIFLVLIRGPEQLTKIRLAPSNAEMIIGVVMIAISLPFLIYYIYKNWPPKNTKLPYFLNKK